MPIFLHLHNPVTITIEDNLVVVDDVDVIPGAIMADIVDATVDIVVRVVLDFLIAIVPDVDLWHHGLSIRPLMSEDNESTKDGTGLKEIKELRGSVISHFNFPFDEGENPEPQV